MRDPQHAVAGELKRGVALSVPLERRSRAVCLVAVEREVLPMCGKALDQWEKRLPEIFDRCPKTWRPHEPKLADVP